MLSIFGLAVIFGLSAAGASAAPKQPGKQAVTHVVDLQGGKAMTWDTAAPTVAAFGCKCDENGDIYLLYSGVAPALSTGAMAEFPVSKISIGSKEIIQYPVPISVPGYQGHAIRLSFDVGPDGTLYALLNTAHRDLDGKMKPEVLIAKYSDDGTIDSYIHIGQVPGKTIQPLRMAVFGNSDFLLSGTTVLKEGVGSFTGLFDQDGDFIRLLALGKPLMDPWHASADKDAHESTEPVSQVKTLKSDASNPVSLESSTLSFSAPDGNVYLLQGTQDATLYVVSSMGEVIRHYKLNAPQPGLSPLQMAEAGRGFLFIYYGYIYRGASDAKTRPRDMISVVNTETGEVNAVYRMPEAQIGLLPACAASSQTFEFLGASKEDKLTLIPYSAP